MAMFSGDRAVLRLCQWIRSSTSSQMAHARYRSALSRDSVGYDSDYAALEAALDEALTGIETHKRQFRLVQSHDRQQA